MAAIEIGLATAVMAAFTSVAAQKTITMSKDSEAMGGQSLLLGLLPARQLHVWQELSPHAPSERLHGGVGPSLVTLLTSAPFFASSETTLSGPF